LFIELLEIEAACGEETKMSTLLAKIVGFPYTSQYLK